MRERFGVRGLARGCSLAALTAGMISAAGAAFAQEPAQVEEVIVTAQRVRENVQQVPVAVTAFGAERLKEGNVESLIDLAQRTPGFTATAVDPIQTNFAIRGIGSAQGISQNAGGDPSVVVFVDGVYAGRGGTPDIDVLNLERIEVLRGPQGTLFGKNAVGGLVQFVSKRPSADNSLMLEGTYGNYDRVSLRAQGNVALSDNVYLSGGVTRKTRDGYEYNETTGNRVNDEDVWAGQAQLLFKPADNLDILLGFDVTHQDQKGNPRHNICNSAFDNGVHCVGVNPDPRTVNAYTDGYLRRDLKTYRAEINWQTSVGTIRSLTALRKVEWSNMTPFFSNPVNPPNQIESTEIGRENNSQFSQELRFSFDGFDKKLKGQLGLYYLHEDNDRVQDLIQDFATPAIQGSARYPQQVTATSFAMFGQFSYAVTDRLTATVGARMTWEEKDGRFAGFKLSGPGLPPPLGTLAGYDVKASEKWEAFTPRFALDWRLTNDVMLYASATRGYKSGGFQGLSGTAAGAATPYDPEFAWGYEGGAKTQWLDGRLRLNLAVFQTDYEDLQISTLVPLCCVVVSNAATARIRGAELEFAVRPMEGLLIDGSYSYLDAKFTDYVVGATVNTGHVLPRSPKDKVNVGVQYSFPVADWSVRARVDYSYQSKSYFDASNIAAQTQDAFSNVDARIGVTSPDKTWEIALWGKNLGDELIRTYATNYPLYQQLLVPYAPPRTYGVTLTYRR